jgi:hypothetical protein
MCVKISNAISAALQHLSTVQAPPPPATYVPSIDIDASHFSDWQACSVNPFSAIPVSWGGHLSIRLGNVKILSQVGWQVDSRNVKILTLTGISPQSTQLWYAGTSAVNAVLAINPAAADCGSYRIENLYLLGYADPSSTPRANTGLFVLNCYRSEFNNIWAWGTQNFGIYVQGGVSDSFRAPRVSLWDAGEVLFSTQGAPKSAGIQLDSFTVQNKNPPPATLTYATTASTISDVAVQGIPGTGIVCAGAGNMVFLAGTSENNGQGVYIGPNCYNTTLIGMDLETNVDSNNIRIDLHDLGSNTTLVNVYAPNRVLNPSSTSAASTGICQGSACWTAGTSAPSGLCNSGSFFTRTDTGDFYVCQSKVWVLK